MRKSILVTSAVAVSMSLGIGMSAQQPTPSQDAAPSSTASQPSSNTTMVHFEGCVFPERALSATSPVVVPPGSTEDYVLTNTEVVAGSAGTAETADAMYQLELEDRERLRSLIGKRVGVTGRIDDESELPEFQVTSIREIMGSCPPTPAARS